MNGEVYAVDQNTLLIRNFVYDGNGKDTFFWAGTSNRLIQNLRFINWLILIYVLKPVNLKFIFGSFSKESIKLNLLHSN